MSGMEKFGSNSSEINDEEMALKGLLDAFGSAFSLDEIASAYCKADGDANLAGKFLFQMQGGTSASAINAVDGEARDSKKSSQSSCANVSEPLREGNENLRPKNPRNHPVSVGSVSSIIGKDYIRTYRPKNGSSEAAKPMKLDANVFPVSALWGKEAKPSSGKGDSVNRDMEEFLYSMLGVGFELERNVIREVLDACGYDMPKSMEKLVALSVETLDKKNKSVCDFTDKFTELGLKAEVPLCEGKSINHSGGNEDTASNTRAGLSSEQSCKIDRERELLTALFGGSERQDDHLLPRKKLTTVKRSGIFGKAVSEPLRDSVVVRKTSAVYPQQQDEYVSTAAEEEEERYQAIRKAVKEYRAMMKDYYQSAVEVFTKGDSVRAQKLLEQGIFFQKKAHDADEESNEMILETRNVEVPDAMVLDLHDHGPKEAIRLLKCHLGIPFTHLKVIIETHEEDSSKGSRRRLVLKLLEKESIKWTEEEAGTLLIQLDSFNRKRLSFAKK